jgi:hypothetical protein
VKSENFEQALDLLKFRSTYKGRYQNFDIKLFDILHGEEKGVVCYSRFYILLFFFFPFLFAYYYVTFILNKYMQIK